MIWIKFNNKSLMGICIVSPTVIRLRGVAFVETT